MLTARATMNAMETVDIKATENTCNLLAASLTCPEFSQKIPKQGATFPPCFTLLLSFILYARGASECWRLISN